MKTIYKYALPIVDEQTVMMPAGAELLTFQIQEGEPCVWALVESTNRMTPQILRIYGTGNPMPKYHGRYVGTIQDPHTGLVWHLFHEEG